MGPFVNGSYYHNPSLRVVTKAIALLTNIYNKLNITDLI